MSLKLYNTASRKKETFQPLKPGKVGIYVCGVTVYDLCHIGHARSAIVFDVLVRYLRHRGFDVTYVRNFTDVDDKIIERAGQLGKETSAIAQEYIDAFNADMDRIRVLPADQEPRATEYIPQMIQMIERLLERGFAYVAEKDVYYAVEAFKEYGGLSGRNLEDMRAGSRIAVDSKKRHPMDFTLWKEAKPGEPQWPSPWGPGRPGWHLECSVMSNHFLGPTFDIHGGGRDLLFPHHENERAQSIAANGGSFARYWIHNGFVTVESEKMSKSLGNFLTIRDALDQYHPEVLRLFLLSKHYRSPLDFSKKDVLNLQSGLVRIYRTLDRLETILGLPDPPVSSGEDPFIQRFIQLMDDDLNTAGSLGLVFEKVRDMNRAMDSDTGPLDETVLKRLKQDRSHLLKVADILGLLQETPAAFFKQLAGVSTGPDTAEIQNLVEKRTEARAQKDWAKADEIRNRLRDMGVVLEDGPQGTTWRLDV
ncbi:MAG: cysteine--tRNA ligase [Thermodesulfobacteriota bacterium]